MKTPTFNPILSQASTEYAASTMGFIAGVLFPTFPTAVQAGEFPVFKKENLLNVPSLTARAPGAAYQRINLEYGKETFVTQDYGVAIPLDDRQKAIYASILDADKGKTTTLTHTLQINKERRAAALITGAGSLIPSSVPTVKWGDPAADLIAQVKVICKVIWENCGLKPNSIAMPLTVWNAVSVNPAIIERIKHTNAGSITTEMVANLFEVEQIIVADSLENTAAEGQPMTVESIWGENVIFAHVSASLDLERPTFGRTFSFNGVHKSAGEYAVMSYRDEEKHSMIHEMASDVQEKIIAPACAYVLKDVLTA